jgi:hypothetical protein
MEYQLDGGLIAGKFVNVTRLFAGEPCHNGLLLGVGESLVLLLQFHDFYPEGYTILRTKDILKVRSGERESFWESILRSEGIISQVEISSDIPLNNIKSFLETQLGQHLIIECENQDSEEDEFYIGRLLSLKDGFASQRTFNSLGVWDDYPTNISYDKITKLQFNTPYIKIISKYLH